MFFMLILVTVIHQIYNTISGESDLKHEEKAKEEAAIATTTPIIHITTEDGKTKVIKSLGSPISTFSPKNKRNSKRKKEEKVVEGIEDEHLEDADRTKLDRWPLRIIYVRLIELVGRVGVFPAVVFYYLSAMPEQGYGHSQRDAAIVTVSVVSFTILCREIFGLRYSWNQAMKLLSEKIQAKQQPRKERNMLTKQQSNMSGMSSISVSPTKRGLMNFSSYFIRSPSNITTTYYAPEVDYEEVDLSRREVSWIEMFVITKLTYWCNVKQDFEKTHNYKLEFEAKPHQLFWQRNVFINFRYHVKPPISLNDEWLAVHSAKPNIQQPQVRFTFADGETRSSHNVMNDDNDDNNIEMGFQAPIMNDINSSNSYSNNIGERHHDSSNVTYDNIYPSTVDGTNNISHTIQGTNTSSSGSGGGAGYYFQLPVSDKVDQQERGITRQQSPWEATATV